MKKLLLALPFLFLPFSAQAVVNKTVTVCQLQATANHAYLRPCTNWTAVTASHGGWIYWSLSTYGGRAMYITALNAKNNGKSVGVRIDDTVSGYYDLMIIIRENEQ